MSEKNGGAAFPCSGYQEWQPQAGMTLRDYFASKAMQGMLACAKQPQSDQFAFARDAYAVADAMLQERAK